MATSSSLLVARSMEPTGAGAGAVCATAVTVVDAEVVDVVVELPTRDIDSVSSVLVFIDAVALPGESLSDMKKQS